MLIRTVLTCCIALLTTAALAAEPVLMISSTGRYYLSQEMPDGSIVTKELTKIVRMGDPVPNPPDDPQPPQSNLSSKVRDATVTVNDPTTAKAMTRVYSLVKDRVESGDLDPSRAFAAVSAATDMLLAAQDAVAKWQPWRTLVSDELAKRAAKGELQSKEDHVKALGEIESGLKAATDGARLGDKINWERLFQLIEMILKLLMAFQ